MNILLVDDEDRSRLHLADFICKLGHIVTEAADGRQALKIFQSRDFDLLLTDNRMPRMSGLELLEAVRNLPGSQNTSKVIFTAYGDMATTVQAMRAGASDYLLKPLNISELVAMIERIASQHETSQQVKSDLAKQNSKPQQENSPVNKSVTGYMHKKFAPNKSLNEIGVFSLSMHHAYELAQKLHTNR